MDLYNHLPKQIRYDTGKKNILESDMKAVPCC